MESAPTRDRLRDRRRGRERSVDRAGRGRRERSPRVCGPAFTAGRCAGRLEIPQDGRSPGGRRTCISRRIQEADGGSIQPLRGSHAQRGRAHQGRTSRPLRLPHEAKGRLRLSRHRGALRRGVLHRHQRRGLHHRRLHALGGCNRLRSGRDHPSHEDRLPARALRPEHHRRQGDDRLVPHARHRQQPGHGRRRVGQDARLLRPARVPAPLRRPTPQHQRLLARPRPARSRTEG